MIQQALLHVPPAERLVEMLAVNIRKQFAEGFQILQGYRVAVNEGAGSAVGADNPSKQAFVVRIDRLVFQPGPC